MTVAAFPTKPKAETAVQAVKRLEMDAATAAQRVSAEIIADLTSMAADCFNASEVKSLPPDERDIYRRLGERIEADIQTINAIKGRV